MNSADVISPVGLQEEPIACPRCGSTSQVGRGLCLNCLLYRGLGEETYDNETLESVLGEIDIRDTDWQLGNYQILDEIGRGGMGVIYRARQRHSRRIVALKRILAHHADSHDTLVRFRREAEAVASLDHPNILPIYEVSEGEDGLPFFSMKFAAGGSLLQSEAALHNDGRGAIALMAKVSRAVEFAHSRGILHRDLKPGNILLDGRGEPLVSDFGLAKWLDESSDLTRTLTVFGTPGYIAPEQAHGPASSLKATADIYSLGAVLFDLIAGRPPFLGEHALSVIQQAAEKPAPKLRSINSKIDRDLETICARCLEREPSARYHSAGGLATDLERWLEGRPIVARPVSPPTRIWRWAKRNPKLAASVAGCILGALAIATFTTLTVGPNARFQPVPVVSEKSVAVLPFQNLSEEKQDALFTTGVQDEILNDLAKVADLKVISRTSAMQYKSGSSRNVRQIARELRVAHIVEGSVQRLGDRIRVNAQLIDTRTDTQLWSERYDRQLADVFALESELAEQIVAKLRATLSPREKTAIEEPPTNDLVAYKLYVRAKDLIEGISFRPQAKEDLIEAARLLESAVSRDPSFLRAYYELARSHDVLYSLGFDHTAARLQLADETVNTALRRWPDSGEVHLALARHLKASARDYARARHELAFAQRALPNEPQVFILAGYIDRQQGRWEESVDELKRAAESDPRNPSILQQLSITYECLRRDKEAAETLDRILAITPTDTLTRISRTFVEFDSRANTRPQHEAIESTIAGNDSSAATLVSSAWFYLALCERDAEAAGRALSYLPADGCRHSGIPFPHSWCEGLAARMRNDNAAARAAFTSARAEVEEILNAQPDYPEGLCALGVIDAALGRKKEAIQEGRRAVELCPVSRDAVEGPLLIQYLAVIYAWTGEKHFALQQLETVARIPAGVSYGDLRLDPCWDPLRSDKRFEKIVASLAPDAKKP
jgi:serine/threonine protein kinase/tetratricopeptide (TPR) repeat protein